MSIIKMRLYYGIIGQFQKKTKWGGGGMEFPGGIIISEKWPVKSTGVN